MNIDYLSLINRFFDKINRDPLEEIIETAKRQRANSPKNWTNCWNERCNNNDETRYLLVDISLKVNYFLSPPLKKNLPLKKYQPINNEFHRYYCIFHSNNLSNSLESLLAAFLQFQ